MDLNTLKSAVTAGLSAETHMGVGRKPSSISALLTKLGTQPELAGFDKGILANLAAACGYGNASSDAAVAVYVQNIKNYINANASGAALASGAASPDVLSLTVTTANNLTNPITGSLNLLVKAADPNGISLDNHSTDADLSGAPGTRTSPGQGDGPTTRTSRNPTPTIRSKTKSSGSTPGAGEADR